MATPAKDWPAIPLRDLEVLALDCQTTGATPRNGQIVEVGWATVKPSAVHPAGPETSLVRLPKAHQLPAAIQKLTGIQPEDLSTAPSPRHVWQRLTRAACKVGSRSEPACVAVIHYARFERAFLKGWHREYTPETPFPFDIICTHTLARRLLPTLPRCGLRALAGYFGMSLSPTKRCTTHVAATAYIWRHLIDQLSSKGIIDLANLMAWQQSRPKPAVHRREYPMPSSLRRKLPDRPGVYHFRRSKGDLLYVGKAKSLKRRVSSYFQPGRCHPEHILEMLTQAVDLYCATTPTALEAALQEAEDIHRLHPEYNIQLQIGELSPVFCSRDYQTIDDPHEKGLPLGPFPSERAIRPLAALVNLLASGENCQWVTEAIIQEAFSLPRPYMPPRAVFIAGLKRFRSHHDLPDGQIAIARRLSMYGAIWWRAYREQAEVPEAEESLKRDGKSEWTSDEVVKYLESVVRQGAHYIRRGRWFRLLSEATLRWEPAEQDGTMPLLKLEGGQIKYSGRLASQVRMPAPENSGRPASHRQACFNAATYVRLRVLTTELRRLVSEGRRVEICMRPGVNMTNEALVKLLFWI